MSIRLFYEKETGGHPLPDDFEVHHIDGNREHNEITNLVALPKHLHVEYHLNLLPELRKESFQLVGVNQSGQKSLSFYVQQLNKFMFTFHECNKWIDFRDYLRGEIANIHKLSYNG